jgi:hypothetical protein
MEPNEIRSQLERLAVDLDQYKPDQNVLWSVGKVANALIEEAKEALPDQPVLAAIDPFTQRGPSVHAASARDLSALIRQVIALLPSPSLI